jgi:transposase, IS30 family
MWRKHLRLEDRIEIYRLIWEWKTQKEIWKLVWCSQWTISKELQRRWSKRKYEPLYADNRRLRIRRECNNNQRKLEKTRERENIKRKLLSKDEDWSPDTIVWRIREEWWEIVCTKTMYNQIHREWWELKEGLRHGRKGYRKRWYIETRWRYNDKVVRIDEREEEVEKRERIGDWEVDTIIWRWRDDRIVTILERKSRYIKMRRWKWSEWVKEGIIELLRWYDKRKRLTMTADNGKEFGKWKEVEENLWIKFYFARPYHSWERWSNENGNRCIRKRLRKWTDFKNISDKDIEKIENMINNKPRKILNYKTPNEIFNNTKTSYFN